MSRRPKKIDKVTYFGTATRTVSRNSESWIKSSFLTTSASERIDKLPLGMDSVLEWMKETCASRLLALHLRQRSLYHVVIIQLGFQCIVY